MANFTLLLAAISGLNTLNALQRRFNAPLNAPLKCPKTRPIPSDACGRVHLPLMPSYTLLPHPSTPCEFIDSLTVDVHPRGADAPKPDRSEAWTLAYRVAGDIGRLQIPSPGIPARTNELWRHTCFEAFVRSSRSSSVGPGVTDSPRHPSAAPVFKTRSSAKSASLESPPPKFYDEFNFSPSGAWAAYRFDHYRSGMRDLILKAPPSIVCQQQQRLLTVEVAIVVPDLVAPSPLALSAVLKDTRGTVSYWALTHPVGRPDFHASAGFTATLG